MRKKWVILAALVFLGVAGWVVVRGNHSGYPVKAVYTALTDHSASVIITEGRIEMPVFRTRRSTNLPKKVINWLKYDLFSHRDEVPFPTFFSNAGSRINLYGKNNRIHEVIIWPGTVDSQDALEIQSKLAAACPGLPCTIAAPSP